MADILEMLNCKTIVKLFSIYTQKIVMHDQPKTCPEVKNKGETTHQIGAKRLTGETTLGETTQGETTQGRNDSGAKQLTGETTRDLVSEWWEHCNSLTLSIFSYCSTLFRVLCAVALSVLE